MQRKSFAVCLLLTVLMLLPTSSAGAAVPYESYVYDHYGQPAPIPPSYVPVDVWDGISSGTEDWNSPGDVAIGRDGRVYVADTGNNRVLVLTPNGKLEAIRGASPDSTDEAAALSQPSGLFVDKDNRLYVADTGNKRIVVFRPDGSIDRIHAQPESPLLPNNFDYRPIRIAVDGRGEMFVASQGLYEGMLELAEDGTFVGFFGANRNKFDLNRFLLDLISTKAQKEKMGKVLPAEFSSVDVDSEGYIYTSTLRLEENQIKKLSPVGVDVMNAKTEKNLYGDKLVMYRNEIRILPQLIDIAVDDSGIITTIDVFTSRIFQYDQSKHLLSVFGAKGNMLGQIDTASAVATSPDGNWIFALDSGLGRLTRYRATEFTQTLHLALTLYNDGRYEESQAPMRRILQLNGMYDLANIGIGKAYLKSEQFDKAMTYFQRGHDKSNYSMAFQHIRMEWLRHHFTAFLVVLVLLYLSIWYVPWLRTRFGRRNKRSGVQREPLWRRYLGVMLHPLNGFEELKDKTLRAGFALMIALLALFVLVRLASVAYTGYILNPVDPQTTSLLMVALMILVPWITWCLVNYGLSTLLDGEGSFKEVMVTSTFAFLPYIVFEPFIILISHYLSEQEKGLFVGLQYLLIVWVLLLLFIQSMVIHQYTFKRNVGLVVLTIIGVLTVWFLSGIFYLMLNQFIDFIVGVYREITFRWSL